MRYNPNQLVLNSFLLLKKPKKTPKPKYSLFEGLLSPIFTSANFKVEGELWLLGDQELYLAHPLLRSEKIEFRDYLMKGAEIGLNHNSLVILPTGLGKTYLAFINCCYQLNQNRKAKILFLAPTVVLVDQHYRSAKEVFIDDIKVGKLTGSLPTKKRPGVWQENNIIFATPQTIESEINKKTINLSDIDFLIIDEAHLVVKNYSYVSLKDCARKQGTKILSLTPLPTGKDLPEVELYRTSLGVSPDKVFAKSYYSKDTQPWVFTRNLRKVTVRYNQPELIKELERELLDYIRGILEKIVLFSGYSDLEKLFKESLIWSGNDLIGVVTGSLLKVGVEIDKLIDENPDDRQYKALKFFWAQIIKANVATERLNTKGVLELGRYLSRQLQLAQKKGASHSCVAFTANPKIQEIYSRSNFSLTENVDQKQLLKDPKTQEIFKLIEKHKSEKIIIFTSLRDSLWKIKHALELKTKEYGLPIYVLTGRQENIDDPGMSRKEQEAVCLDFQKQKKGILLATSVAEAGLNLSVDAAIFYEPILAVRSYINRLGRVARDREGIVYILVYIGTDEEKQYHIIQAKEKNTRKIINYYQLLNEK